MFPCPTAHGIVRYIGLLLLDNRPSTQLQGILPSSICSPIRRSASHIGAALVWATATSMAEAQRLIDEQMELGRRSLGAEWTTGCLEVVNQCIFRSRRPWGV